MAIVIVDGENVRRSLWPNMPRAELMERSRAWGDRHGHQVEVIWEGAGTADDEIARLAAELDGEVWVVTSDRGLHERVAGRAARVIGAGSFARELHAEGLRRP
jgi:predicted RNA-binding protein with PIN domain